MERRKGLPDEGLVAVGDDGRQQSRNKHCGRLDDGQLVARCAMEGGK